MNILIVTDVYTPNANSSAVLMRDLALSLVKKNFNVHVLTLLEANTLETKSYASITEEEGVKVLRVRNIRKKTVGKIRRGLSELLLPYIMYRGFQKYFKNDRPDLIICYSPPITLEKTVNRLKRKYGPKTYLVLRDLFPQCALDVGVLKPGIIFNSFKEIENKLYEVSDYIGVQSLSDLKTITNTTCKLREKVELLYNWVDVAQYEKIIKKDFRREFGLQNKIVCLYAGNIGEYQELGFLFELIKLNFNRTDVVFLIVGSGSQSRELRDEYGDLDNVMFQEFVCPELYPDLVRQCDIGLINLSRSLTIQNIPGKLLGYWSSKLPVLASLNPNNDLQDIIKDADGGLCSVTGDLLQYNDNFNRLCDDMVLRDNQGASGYLYTKKHFSVDNARDTILKHFIN